MKRNFLTPVVRSILAIALLASGVFVSAQNQWRPLRSMNAEARPQGAVVEQSPISKALNRRVPGNPENEVLPLGDGIYTIPTRKAPANKPKPIFRSPEAPRGNVYTVVNRGSDIEWNYQAYVGKLNLSTGYLTKLHSGAEYCPYSGDDYQFQGDSYRNGQIVLTKYGYTDNGTCAIWTFVDLESGKIVDEVVFEDQLAEGYNVVYNPDLDIFFVITIDMNNGEGDSIFGIVNPNGKTGWEYYYGGKLETSNQDKPAIMAAAYNPGDKQLYGFDSQNNVYTIEWNKSNDMYHPDCILVPVGEIVMPDDSFLFEASPYGPIPGQICYSPMDEMFVAAYRDNMYQKNRIVYVHPETFEAIFGKDITSHATPYISTIFCVDDYASSDAPVLANEPKRNFVNGNLSGKITFEVPSESFIGVDLTGTTLSSVVKIDGKVIDERQVKAGESFTLDLNLEQGLHTLEFTTAAGDNVSPVRKTIFYAGFDAPKAPKGITLVDNNLSWEKPGEVGEHDGFVDVNDITYDIYLDNVKQNAAPVKENKFTLAVPEKMNRSEIAVTATSKGQTSPKGSIREIFGKAFDIPFLNTPTREESYLYTIINANNDVRTINFGTNTVAGQKVPCMVFQTGYIEDADDWMFLPAIKFTDNSKLYSFDIDIRGVYSDMVTSESVEFYIANKPTVAAAKAGTMIHSDANLLVTAEEANHLSLNFAVPTPGDYYVGIHITSTRDQSAQGMTFQNMAVKAIDGASSAVPGEPTDITIVAAENGEQSATFTAKLPTKDILGNPLPADQDITLELAYTDEGGHKYSTEKTGKPGETVTMELGVDRDGFITFIHTPSNVNGSGYSRNIRIYVGIDTPLCPENIHGIPSSDNRSILIKWDAPGNVGKNGGFVDLADPSFKYNVYTRTGVSLAKIGETKELEYNWEPFGGNGKAKLDSYVMGPTSVNSVGESVQSLFFSETLGDPYELPMKEEWNSTYFTYNPYNYDYSGAYSKSQWSSSRSAVGLNVGDPMVVEGCIMSYSSAGSTLTKLIFPKATTLGIQKANFILKVWDYAEAPKSIQLYGRRDGQLKSELIGEYKLSNPRFGEWVNAEFPLPESYMNCGWIQLAIEAQLVGSEKEYLLLDNFQLMPDADYDLKLVSIDGITQAMIGDKVSYNVTVANAGRERLGAPLKVEILDKDGKVIASENTTVEQLGSNQTFEYEANFEINGAFAKEEQVTVRATVDSDDENLKNNSRELTLDIMSSQFPVVNDLEAVENEAGDVELKWTVPTATYGNFENFEDYNPFELTETIGYWGNKDMDGVKPIILQNQATGSYLKFPNFEEPAGWMVYDYEELGMPDARIKPHSGNKALMVRAGNYDETTESKQSSKWLISPEIKPSTSVSFWISTLATDLTEYCEIWVSEVDPEKSYLSPEISAGGKCGTFRKIRSISKSGSEVWEFVSQTFDRRARQFAIRYSSFDSLCLVLDDLSFTPAKMLDRTATSFSVYRAGLDGSNPECIAENITDTSFVDTTFKDKGYYTYYVIANCEVDGNLKSGARSNVVSIIASSVGEITAASGVTGGKGVIRVNNFAGENLVIAATDGKIMYNTTANSNNAAYAVDKGIYVVTVGKRNYKVVVR